MKINHFIQLLNSTLSCILKCLSFRGVIHKKIIIILLAASFIAGCTSPSAMLGPAYTLSSTGNTFQATLSYGSNEIITAYTGKTPIENVKEVTLSEKNIQKQTLESEDFYILVKNKIDQTGAILRKSNQ